MTLVDSSAWIEFFRQTESAAHLRLRALVTARGSLLTTEPVLMELLAGATTERERANVSGALGGCRFEPAQGPGDWTGAASIYRACRQRGVTPRNMLDCLIAAVALRVDAEVLAHDRDFELIASVTPLRLAEAI